VNFLHESYVQEYEHREKLADIERRWMLVELERAQGKRPFLHRTSQFFHFLGQLRRIRIQVSFEVHEPCPDGAAVR